MVAVGRLHISDKVQHFCAYLALSALPVIGFRDRRSGIVTGISMFVLGILLEAGQHFSPGRIVELGDVSANGVGVSCGVLLAPPIRTLIAILCAARNSLPQRPRLTDILKPTLWPVGRKCTYSL